MAQYGISSRGRLRCVDYVQYYVPQGVNIPGKVLPIYLSEKVNVSRRASIPHKSIISIVFHHVQKGVYSTLNVTRSCVACDVTPPQEY